jgi:hypothetical protein
VSDLVWALDLEWVSELELVLAWVSALVLASELVSAWESAWDQESESALGLGWGSAWELALPGHPPAGCAAGCRLRRNPQESPGTRRRLRTDWPDPWFAPRYLEPSCCFGVGSPLWWVVTQMSRPQAKSVLIRYRSFKEGNRARI